MFGLNESAVIYALIGQSNGKPVYSQNGVRFRCRTEPERITRIGDARSGIEYTDHVRIFARGIAANDGDRIVVSGGNVYKVLRVEIMRGRASVHHLEIIAEVAL